MGKLHVLLKRMLFYVCLFVLGMVLWIAIRFQSLNGGVPFFYILFCLLVLSITKRQVLKCPAIFVDFSISPSICHFLLYIFEALLFGGSSMWQHAIQGIEQGLQWHNKICMAAAVLCKIREEERKTRSNRRKVGNKL